MSILIVAEHDHATLKSATRHVLTAAQQMDAGPVHILLAGHNCAAAAQTAAALAGVEKVLHVDAAHYADQAAENLALLVSELVKQGAYTHVLAAASSTGKNMLPRAAALLDVSAVSEITGVKSADTFVRPIYAGNALATVQSSDAIKVISVRTSAFAAAEDGGVPNVVSTPAAADLGLTRVVNRELAVSERPELGSARVVISGGRGLGSGEQYRAVLEPLADKLNGALGASRAAVDAGYVPNDYQVGQTGKVVAPDLYIAVGISGAIQHLAGMKDSKVIVAINKDPDAPIFQVADYALVGDLFQLVPELTQAL